VEKSDALARNPTDNRALSNVLREMAVNFAMQEESLFHSVVSTDEETNLTESEGSNDAAVAT
jgi:DNA invertase Pin-like site-specific DNA recombinase